MLDIAPFDSSQGLRGTLPTRSIQGARIIPQSSFQVSCNLTRRFKLFLLIIITELSKYKIIQTAWPFLWKSYFRQKSLSIIYKSSQTCFSNLPLTVSTRPSSIIHEYTFSFHLFFHSIGNFTRTARTFTYKE